MRINEIKTISLGLTVIFLLASCSQTLMQKVSPPDFSDLAELNLSVGQISTEDLHNDSSEYPHMDRLSLYPLVGIIDQWTGTVLKPSLGSEGVLVLQVLDASLIEEKLPRTGGIQGLFTLDQSEIYHGHILLKLKVNFRDYSGEMDIESRASQSVFENITLRERQQIWVNLGNKMVRDIDRQLRSTISEELPRLQLTQ